MDPRRIVLLRDALTLTPPDEDVSMPPSNVPEPLQLLAVGTMTSRKGYDTLLQACLALQKAGVDFRLTLVGTGPWRLRLRLLAWRLGLRKLVSFPGQLPHEAKTDLYRRADIFIAPGHMTRGGDMDGLPSALTEAMAFGVAVVVSDLPGQLEVVQNGRNGIVVPQNDVTALSQTLLDLSASAEKRRHLGAEAWKRIREVLDEEATEARLTSLFKAACHRCERAFSFGHGNGRSCYGSAVLPYPAARTTGRQHCSGSPRSTLPGAAENGMELEYITEEESPWRPELCRIWEQSVDLAAQPDPFCCAPVWQLSAHRAFAPGRRVLAQHTEDSVLVLAEAFLSPGQPLLTSL